MSSNLEVVNFAVGGTLTVSGDVTLSQAINSSNNATFLELTVTGSSTFNNYLPTSTQTPSIESQLTTKLYVDTANTALNSKITTTDSAQKTYIDNADGVLNSRITTTDSAQKTYIDSADSTLNDRITLTDSAQKTYIDSVVTDLTNNLTKLPRFHVYNTVSQSILFNSTDRIKFNTTLYDVGYNNVSLYYDVDKDFDSYLPKLAGYYYFNSIVTLDSITFGQIYFFKNNVEIHKGSNVSSSASSRTLQVNSVIYMNGTSDYLQVKVFSSGSPVTKGINNTTFQGYFIRG